MPLNQISTSDSIFNGRVTGDFHLDRANHVNAVGLYGAPMGWSNTPTTVDETPVKVSLRRVPIRGGYDPQGHYYGMPNDVWDATPEADGMDPFRFRARHREAAKDEVRRFLPNARFYR